MLFWSVYLKRNQVLWRDPVFIELFFKLISYSKQTVLQTLKDSSDLQGLMDIIPNVLN